jgi:hypothetical protein
MRINGRIGIRIIRPYSSSPGHRSPRDLRAVANATLMTPRYRDGRLEMARVAIIIRFKRFLRFCSIYVIMVPDSLSRIAII